MSSPSPYTHLWRLGTVAAVFLGTALWMKSYFTPPSWNHVSWHRDASLHEVASQPLAHGGNESCRSCHEEDMEEVEQYGHQNLNCESCHGPLRDHALGEDKIADAVLITQSDDQCMICHRPLISRPPDYPQFTDEPRKHRNLKPDDLCLKCHYGHDP